VGSAPQGSEDERIVKSPSGEPSEASVHLVQQLMSMLEGTSIAELEVEHGQVSVFIQRDRTAAAASTATVSSDLAAEADSQDQESTESVVTASYVGVFQRAPDAPVVGADITTGTKLGEIEVLGIRNPVLANADGILSSFFVDDSGAVEYGQPIAAIRPRTEQ
jgi:acetyl-CoA carboxylase biotin carboxyl carrier protein